MLGSYFAGKVRGKRHELGIRQVDLARMAGVSVDTIVVTEAGSLSGLQIAADIARQIRYAVPRNAMAIWQDLVDTCGFAAGYQSVRRFVTKLRGKQSPEACAVIETAPGEDYGESGVMVRTRWRPAPGAGVAALKTTLDAT